MPEVERFSHGPDGFWQDPDGLYVEFKDFKLLQSYADLLRKAGEKADEQIATAEQELMRRAFDTSLSIPAQTAFEEAAQLLATVALPDPPEKGEDG